MRTILEAEVQELAQWVVELVEAPSAKRCWVVNAHGAARAQAVLRTASEYAEAIACEPWKDRRLQMRKCYLAWHRLLQAEFHQSNSTSASGSCNVPIDKSVKIAELYEKVLTDYCRSASTNSNPLSYM